MDSAPLGVGWLAEQMLATIRIDVKEKVISESLGHNATLHE
jgi:hypothetical protein